MIIAIALNGNQPDSTISRQFARCRCFALYEIETGALSMVDNPACALKEKAGPAVLDFLRARNVDKVISGEFGAGVQTGLQQLGIQMIIVPDDKRRLQTILDFLKSNE